jgi:coenzyme F420-0:L-glutamate ligase/coenzyme F420-1:gamma-L-glutamate ligase
METKSFLSQSCTEAERPMRLYPVKTRVVNPGDNLVEIVLNSLREQMVKLEDDDVLALASKIVSYSQGRIVKLGDVKPSERAKKLAKKYSLQPEFAELILSEAEKVFGGVEKAVLTLKDCIMTANAGIDNKNAPVGSVVLWPENLMEWLRNFRDEINRKTGRRVAVVVVDSGLIPLRIGTVGLALAVAGFNPIKEYRGKKDLYGRSIMMTRHAVADDVASSAHLLMGEAVEKTPVVLIKDASLDFDNEVHGSAEMMMPFRECIFMNTFKK